MWDSSPTSLVYIMRIKFMVVRNLCKEGKDASPENCTL